MSTILADWQPHHPSLFGEHILRLKHRLNASPLFSDEALARLIERTPAAHCYVNTMDKRSHNPRSRREGAIDGLSGEEALEAVRAGNIWINIHKLHETDAAYDELLDDIFGEFEGRVPGLKTYRRSMTLLISSPKVQVYYHCDVPGQMLWQMRGDEARLRLSEQGAVPDAAGDGEDRARRGARDGHALRAVVRRLRRGDRPGSRRDAALAAQLPAPRRQPRLPERLDDDRALDRRAPERLRGQLRQRRAPPHLRRPQARRAATSGPSFWAKAGLTAAMKATGMQKRHQRKPPDRLRRRSEGRRTACATSPPTPSGARRADARARAGARRPARELDRRDAGRRDGGGRGRSLGPRRAAARRGDRQRAGRLRRAAGRMAELEAATDAAGDSSSPSPGAAPSGTTIARNGQAFEPLDRHAARSAAGSSASCRCSASRSGLMRIATGFGEPYQQYTDVLIAPDAPANAAERLLDAACRLGCDGLHLLKVRDDSPLAPLLAARGAIRSNEDAAPFVDLTPFPISRPTIPRSTRRRARTCATRATASRARGELAHRVLDRPGGDRRAGRARACRPRALAGRSGPHLARLPRSVLRRLRPRACRPARAG